MKLVIECHNTHTFCIQKSCKTKCIQGNLFIEDITGIFKLLSIVDRCPINPSCLFNSSVC